MALWAQMTPQLQFLSTQILNELYPDTFPLDVRHYLASWIEEQKWENFDVDNMEQEPQARRLLDQMVHLLQEVAQHNPNVVERVKLQHISRNLVCTTNIPNPHDSCWFKATVTYKTN